MLSKDIYHGLTGTGPYDKSAPTPQPQQSPAANALMSGAGSVFGPQADPRNYPPGNWPEKIARGAGNVATQAAIGRGGAALGEAALTGTAPSAITIKQIIGSGVSGATAGAGSETGRGIAQRAVDIDPDFRRLHPAVAQMIEDAGGVVGGGAGGWAGSSFANRVGISGGAPRAGHSPEELETIANSQYNAAKALNPEYKPPAVAQWANAHAQDLYSNYGSAEIQPILRTLNKLSNPPPMAVSVPMTELTALDDQLGKVVQKNIQPDGSMSKMGSAARDTQQAIRNFIKNPTPQSVHSGDPYTAAKNWNDADANWAAAQRSKTVANQKFTPKTLRGFTPDEQAQITKFQQGSPTRNAASGVSKFLGHSSALGFVPAAIEGYEKGGLKGALLAGAAPAVAGYGFHKVSDYLKNSALNRIAEQTRQRSPAYQSIPMDERAASPFRTTVPVGLGAFSGLTGQ